MDRTVVVLVIVKKCTGSNKLVVIAIAIAVVIVIIITIAITVIMIVLIVRIVVRAFSKQPPRQAAVSLNLQACQEESISK